MGLRVAIASSSGKFVDQHFGKCTHLYVFDIGEEGFRLAEVRENAPACGTDGDVEGALERTAELIGDCQAVVVSRLGHEANDILREKGIEAYMVADLVEEVLKKFIKYINLKVRSGKNV